MKSRQRLKRHFGLWIISICTTCLGIFSPVVFGDTNEDWIGKLKDPNPAVRNEAIQKLGDSKDPRAVAPLIEILEPKRSATPAKVVPTDPAAAKVHQASLQVGRIDRTNTPSEPLDAATMRKLTAGLRSKMPNDRKLAAQQLGQSGDKRAVRPLMAALRNSNFFVRGEILEALGTLGDPQAFDVISSALKAREAPVRQAAAKALGELGDPRAAALLYQALTTDAFLRSQAADALARLGTTEGIKQLNLAVNNKDTFISKDAEKALDSLGPQHGLEPLIDLLKDPDPKVRLLAAEALKDTGDPLAEEALKELSSDSDPSLQKMAEQASTESPIQKTKILAIQALGKIGHARAIDPLFRALRSGDEPLQRAAGSALGSMKSPIVMKRFQTEINSTDSKICIQAIQDLGYINNDQAIKLLGQAASRSDVFVARPAVEALSKTDKPAAIPYLSKALDNSFLRNEALEGLLAQTHPDVVPALILVLKSNSFVEREKAVVALGQRKDSRAVEPLVALLKANDTPVLEEVIVALDQIDDKKAGASLIEIANNPFVGEKAIALIQKWNWQPETLREKCLWFIANHQYDECVKLGPQAADFLLEELKKSNSGDAAEALAALNDSRALPILEKNLSCWQADAKQVKAMETLGWKPDSFEKQVQRAVALGDITTLKQYWKQDNRMRQMVESALNSSEASDLFGAARLIISMRLTEMVKPLAGKLSTGDESQQWQLVNQFLQSQNTVLYNAGKTWADKHNYRVIEFKIPGPSNRW